MHRFQRVFSPENWIFLNSLNLPLTCLCKLHLSQLKTSFIISTTSILIITDQAGLSNLGSFVIWSDNPRVVPSPTRPSPVFKPSRRWSLCGCFCGSDGDGDGDLCVDGDGDKVEGGRCDGCGWWSSVKICNDIISQGDVKMEDMHSNDIILQGGQSELRQNHF